MAAKPLNPKPLQLKRERGRGTIRAKAFEKSVNVLIDHDLAHLDQPFSYGVPEQLMEQVRIGSKVLVPFNKEEREGVVISEFMQTPIPNKPLLKVLNSYAYQAETLELAEVVASRYATSVTKVLRSVPEAFSDICNSEISEKKKKPVRFFEYLTESSFDNLEKDLQDGQDTSLILLPTEKEAERLFSRLVVKLGDRAMKAFGRAKFPKVLPLGAIVIGTRNAIFWQIPNLAKIVVIDELSEHFWSNRNPYWNVRDVALLRSNISGVDLSFISAFPSAEILRLVDIGYLRELRGSRRTLRRRQKITAKPDSYHRTVREGLDKGVVLVQTATKDYSALVLCKSCRSRPSCSCGYPLKLIKGKIFLCLVCGLSSADWRCAICMSQEKILLNRGAIRIEEELGKAFPNTPIRISTGDKPLEVVPDGGIVVATPGMHPTDALYSAVVLLDGELQLNRPTLRAEERLVSQWFATVFTSREGAPVYLDLPAHHRVVNAMVNDSRVRLGHSILEERKITHLPPWFRIIRLQGAGLGTANDLIQREFPFAEISKMTGSSELLIRVPVERSAEVTTALYALVKYRAATQKDLLSISVDPFDI